MKKLLTFAALLLPPSGAALAQETYVGLSGNIAYVFDVATETVDTDAFTVSPGAQLGVRNLLGPFGLRLTGEYGVYPATGFLEVGGDLLLNLGTVVDPYAGIGVGLANQGGASVGMARLFGGVAPRFDANFGAFAESDAPRLLGRRHAGFRGQGAWGRQRLFLEPGRRRSRARNRSLKWRLRRWKSEGASTWDAPFYERFVPETPATVSTDPDSA